jgi:hypothetical protein
VSVTEQNGELGRKLLGNMERMTLDRIGTEGLDNAKRNLAHLSRGQTLRELRVETREKGDVALVIGAGPSLHRRPVAETIKRAEFRGTIIVTDSCMSYCLRNGIVPDLVVTLDPHAKRIVRWFGDPKLLPEDREVDDYHARQDMDPAFADELAHNRAMISLLDHHGKDMRIALSTSASQAVVERVLETGMKIFWWNPMYDAPDAPNSVTRELFALNKLPCLNAGGNVGSACWMIADAVLGKRQIGLAGIDFGYYADTPYERTQYYRECVALVGEDHLDAIFMKVHNPHLDQWFYTDPAYMWYRESFLAMVKETDCKTYNCTEGGILFGDGIDFIPLDRFLREVSRG